MNYYENVCKMKERNVSRRKTIPLALAVETARQLS